MTRGSPLIQFAAGSGAPISPLPPLPLLPPEEPPQGAHPPSIPIYVVASARLAGCSRPTRHNSAFVIHLTPPLRSAVHKAERSKKCQGSLLPKRAGSR